MTYQPTPRELVALGAFIGWSTKTQGWNRRWKADLRHSWETCQWPRHLEPDMVAALQGLRNNHGPRWLAAYRMPPR